MVRDLLTCRALGATCQIIVTAWTEQDHQAVRTVELREPNGVGTAVRRAVMGGPSHAHPPPDAVKIGMLGSGAHAVAVAGALDGYAGPVVLDPVLGASTGGALFRTVAGETVADALAPVLIRATLVTPNTHELASLTGRVVQAPDQMQAAAAALLRLGSRAVLAKGGHLVGDPVDWLVEAAGLRAFMGSRIPGASPRGTGCALASAVAVNLASGVALDDAIALAKRWVADQIARAMPVRGDWHLPG